MIPAGVPLPEQQPQQPPDQSAKPPAPPELEGESRDIIRGSIIRNILDAGKEKKGDEKEKPATQKEGAKEEKPPATPPAGAADQEPKPAEPATPPNKRKPRGKPIDSVSTHDLVTSTARAVGGAVVQAIQASPPVRTDAPASELPDEVRSDLEIYNELHRIDPGKYPADLPQRLAKFGKEEIAYADKWESQHSGETFDGNAEEHEGWYDSHQPKVAPEDFAYAKASLRIRKDLAGHYEPKIRELEGQLRKFQIEPEIRQAATTAALPILQAINPEVKELSADSIGAFKTKDPIGWEIAQQVDQAMAASIVEAGKLWHGITTFDANNPMHKVAQQAFSEVQDLVKQLPASQLKGTDGRKFLPMTDYYGLPDNARQQFFTITYEDVAYYIANRIAPGLATDLYKNRRAEVERMAGMLGFVKPSAPQKQEETNGATPHPAALIPQSPSVGAGEPRTGNTQSGQTQPANYKDFFFDRLLKR